MSSFALLLRFTLVRVAHVCLCLGVVAHAQAAFLNTMPWVRGSATSSTYQEWDICTSTTGGNVPNTPGVPVNDGFPNVNQAPFNSNGEADIQELTGTTFLTSGGNIYSNSDLIHLQIDVPNPAAGAATWTTIILQTRTLGSILDLGTVHLAVGANTYAPAYSALRNSTTIVGGFGGIRQERIFEFVVPGNASNYTLDFWAAESSMSLDLAAVDTFWTANAQATRLNGGVASKSGTWTNYSGDRKWTTVGDVNNWDTGYPTGAGYAATFDNAGLATSAGAVDLSGGKTIGKLVLNTAAGGYTLGLSGTANILSFDNTGGSGNAAVAANAGTHTINAKLATTSASHLDVTVSTGAALTLVSGIDNSAAKSVLLSNTDGTLAAGNIANLGVLTVHGAVSGNSLDGSGSLSLNAGAVFTVDRVRQLNGVHLNGGNSNSEGRLVLRNSGTGALGDTAGTSWVGSLTIEDNATTLDAPPPGVAYTQPSRIYYGTFELANNDLIINNVGAAGLAPITDMIRSGQGGFAAQTWTGTGLTSSYAANQSSPFHNGVGLGVIRNDSNPTTATVEARKYSEFGGLTGLGGDEILVKFTYYGDFDLDGKITSFDYALLDAGFAGALQADGQAGWFFGDANYDGLINSYDYAMLQAGYSTYTVEGQGAPLPEPGTFIMAVAGAIGLFLARRKNRPRFVSIVVHEGGKSP